MRIVGRQLIAVAALLAVSLAAVGCDEGKPDTFNEDCDPDGGMECKDPFRCIRVDRTEDDPDPVPICTKACSHDRDCPRWTNSSGHCTGTIQAVCVFGYCQGWCS
jgi:hypothetical protein